MKFRVDIMAQVIIQTWLPSRGNNNTMVARSCDME